MQPQVFNFNSHSIRTVTLPNGEPGFVGKDVCEVLGYTDTVNALKQHCRGGVAKHHPILDALGRMQQTRILMADDVAALAAGSTLPGAKEAARDLLSAMGVPHVVVKNERDELVFGEEVVERLFPGTRSSGNSRCLAESTRSTGTCLSCGWPSNLTKITTPALKIRLLMLRVRLKSRRH